MSLEDTTSSQHEVASQNGTQQDEATATTPTPNNTSDNNSTTQLESSAATSHEDHPDVFSEGQFVYTYVEPHLLVRTADVFVRMLPLELPFDSELNDGMSRALDSISRIPPFSRPLPIPPSSKLYKKSLQYQIGTTLDIQNDVNDKTGKTKPIQKKPDAASKGKVPEPNNPVRFIRRKGDKFPESLLPHPKGIPVKIAVLSQKKTNLDEPKPTPYQATNLKYNSMGYVYEDAWNVEKTRPVIAKVLLRDDYNLFNSQKKKDDNENEPSKKEKTKIVDRSKWQSMVLKRNPLVQEIRDRTHPLWRAISFGHVFDAGTREVKEALTDEVILNVILQHLVFEGLKNTKKTLEEESGHTYKWIDVDQSLLHGILKEAIKKSERLYDLVLSDKIPATDLQKLRYQIAKEIDEMMAEFGIEDEALADRSSNKNDVNIWEEQQENGAYRNMIVEVDPVRKTEQLQHGSLNVLVTKLTTPNSDNNHFVKGFLTTYLSFTSPEQFFEKLAQRYEVPKHEMTEVEFASKRTAIQESVLEVLKVWLQNYFNQLNPKLVSKIANFIEDEVSADPYLQKDADQLRSIIAEQRKRQKALAEIQSNPNVRLYKNGVDDDTIANNNLFISMIGGTVIDPKEKYKNVPDPKIPMNKLFGTSFNIMDLDEDEIARQMTLVEFELFAAIQPQEFLNQAWNLTKLKYRAMNIIKMRQHYENVKLWVASSVVTGPKPYDRKHRIKKWIKVAEYLRNMRNYNSLRAVLDGIDDSAIARMKATQDELATQSAKQKNELTHFISEENNYAPYKEALKQKAGEPTIPYLEIHLKDLIFLENVPNYTKHNHVDLINWTKREQIYDIISEIQRFQEKGYNWVRVYQIQQIIETMPERLSRFELDKLSVEMEPD